MSITYFFMLLFVFWTLLLFARIMVWRNAAISISIQLFWSVLWAILGTFFFHNIW